MPTSSFLTGLTLPSSSSLAPASAPIQWGRITCSSSKGGGARRIDSLAWGSAEESSPRLAVEVEVEVEKGRVRSRRSFCGACLLGLAASRLGAPGSEALALTATTRREAKEAASPFDEDRLLQQNRRMQKLNGAPTEFPGFIREGFDVKVVTNDQYVTTKTGLIYCDIVVGQGEPPQDGQQVIFHYIGYNESGRRVDSSYQQGQPARTRVGIKGMIPGFEEGIKSMRSGGKRRIIIPPDLGPPVGPSTFFSAKQFEVFDVELLDVKSCERRTVFLYSDVVCE
ncbi:hypothetical protein MPTK1_7g09550 [Marchantia polymorpha subsp. ruderalis]|uniref:peptidylprolyl isomerase n=2 Tax=Marchantia polymorpha TaxID=3197 RepID=A0A176W7Y0_MARPO|nr:hypothetical protein AXG93_3678s1060 [Marchantia polymorpha subsp. ruderalis]PTQ28730.1 hypothetical protein MARPO_0156s0027 [Marchantia polymorpha]PTQ35901.1 hypothetical protein MARPO_0068s0106 [Marchantia polymorpha]BBN16819.1 hypothetical protein Mp_7g09550 [Marchantia polymorpha subsp. ruderalis]BBN16820.1 hypothetical protein Mp_7g09560 [Marchantia polymorpha subsp. ruderalis]|eukprot:PTQ28730.1 hypothetical protein MARPO_0156s0027 [Marchantia polymorpha]